MIVTSLINLLLTPFKLLLEFILSLLPDTPSTAGSLVNVIVFLKKGLWFFDYDLFCTYITCILAFVTLQFAWSIVEWIYKKIPGIK